MRVQFSLSAQNLDVVELVKILDLGSREREFESLHLDNTGVYARGSSG